MPQPKKNYGARYSVPVSVAGAELVAAEMAYQEGVGNKKPLGQMLGELIEETLQFRQNVRNSTHTKPDDKSDPVIEDHAGVDPMNYSEATPAAAWDNEGPGLPDRIPG